MADVSITERDTFIASYLERNEDPKERTIRRIWEAAQGQHDPSPREGGDIRDPGGIGETVSLSTYHRTVGKLVSQGKLEVDTELPDGTKCYKVADRVSSITPLSTGELNRMLWGEDPATAMAVHGRISDRFEENKAEILGEAARGLLQEDPQELVLRMLRDRASDLDYQIADLKDRSVEISRQEYEQIEQRLEAFGRFVHGELGISPSVWKVPRLTEIDETEISARKKPSRHVRSDDWSKVGEELRLHVYGDAFLQEVEIDGSSDEDYPLVVAGTDGSSHAGRVRGLPAAAYDDIDRVTLTFNNSAAFVDVPEGYYTGGEREPESPYYGVPITRAALESASNRGMIVSPPWFPDLDEGQYEHMKKVALDVVQYRIDEDIIRGRAVPYGSNSMGGGPSLPKPDLHLRDGTVIPQAREWSNYTSQNPYGDLVEEGINLSYSILQDVRESPSRVFAGSVKNTRLRVFSKIINWYIQRGSEKTFGDAIDPNWDASEMSNIPDSKIVSELISAAPKLDTDNQYYRVCVIARPFPAMASKTRRIDSIKRPEDWFNFFRDDMRRQSKLYEDYGGSPPVMKPRDVREDEYVKMCAYADFGMFYFGKPGQSTDLRLPRFDFVDSLREQGQYSLSQAENRVEKSVETIIRGVSQTRWAQDYDHNMFTDRKLPKLTPYVVYDAHEKAKALGHKLVSELQQAVAERMSNLIDQDLPKSAMPKDASIEPLSAEETEQQVKKMAWAAKQMGEGIGGEISPGRESHEKLGEEESAEGLPSSEESK